MVYVVFYGSKEIIEMDNCADDDSTAVFDTKQEAANFIKQEQVFINQHKEE